MEILRFYKENNRQWYADIPSWTGRKSALRMVAGADDLLDIIAKERNEVYLHFSENEIEDADVLYFKKKNWINGATYKLKKYKEINYNIKVWLCNVTLHVLGKFPQRIYFKEVVYDIKERCISFGNWLHENFIKIDKYWKDVSYLINNLERKQYSTEELYDWWFKNIH